MVTAGVFLIIRCSPLFECVPSVLTFIVIIGAATAFMAATSGLLQNDLKKVIAYSTCSQLGYMIFVCGLSGYTASLFHLSTHAFFKALLFLSAGAVIHAVAGEQDMRKFGGLARMLPYTYAAFFVGSIALMGVPFLSGFYSKDLILEVAGGSASVTSDFAYTLGLISAFFTSFYSFRLLYLAFYGESRTSRLPLEHTHELTPRMATALLVLAFGSVFLGILGRDIFVGPGTDFWNDSIAVGPALAVGQLSGEFMSTSAKLVPLVSALIATSLVFYIYGVIAVKHTLYGTFAKFLSPYRFFSYKWGFDTVYNQLLNKPLMEGAYNITFSLIDKGLLEVAGPTGLGRQTILIGRLLSAVQTGRAYDYAGFMLVALYFALLGMNFL
jgi:NADH:ubiquinone oxidoreductase subunit 5 (subunit L)/multisubunit Na+/H+ antiporter MnhA subunit